VTAGRDFLEILLDDDDCDFWLNAVNRKVKGFFISYFEILRTGFTGRFVRRGKRYVVEIIGELDREVKVGWFIVCGTFVRYKYKGAVRRAILLAPVLASIFKLYNGEVVLVIPRGAKERFYAEKVADALRNARRRKSLNTSGTNMT